MTKDMDQAAAAVIGCAVVELPLAFNEHKIWLAGAVWGMQAAKLSQAEIAAITAAVATQKEKD